MANANNNNNQVPDGILKEVQGFDFETQMAGAQRGLQLREQFTEFGSPEMATRLENRASGGGNGGGNTLQQGDCLFFDPDKVKVGIVEIGINGATVMLVPYGVIDAQKKPVLKGIKQIYLSQFTKTIRVTDSQGDPVLDPNGNPVIKDGHGNAIWDAMTALSNERERLEFLRNKVLKVSKVIRDFGPSGYVEIGNARVPKAHRLTTLYLFEEV